MSCTLVCCNYDMLIHDLQACFAALSVTVHTGMSHFSSHYPCTHPCIFQMPLLAAAAGIACVVIGCIVCSQSVVSISRLRSGDTAKANSNRSSS